MKYSAVARFSRPFLYVMTALFFVASVPALIHAIHQATDNSIERWIDPHSPAMATYNQFKQSFGTDEFFVVAISGKPLFEQSSVDAMLDAQTRLERVPRVNRVTGIPSVYRDLFGADDLDALREDFTNTPFYEGLFISKDHSVAGLFLELDPPSDAPSRDRLLEGIQAAITPLQTAGFRTDLVGPLALNVALNRMSERESRRAMPIALVVSVAMLVIMLRSLRATIAATACAFLSIVLPLGLMQTLGYPMTMISAALPPLLWVLSLLHSIHIVSRYQFHRTQLASWDACRFALKDTALPCSLCAITTAAGFYALKVSPMPPIQQMGVFAAFGLVLSLAINLCVAPVLCDLLRVRSRKESGLFWTPALAWVKTSVVRRPWLVAGTFSVLLISGIVSLGFVNPEPNPLSFLPKSAPQVQSYNFVSEHLTGLYSIELVVDCPGGWINPTHWNALDQTVAKVQSHPSVARVVSALDFLKKLNHWDSQMDPAAYRLPDSAEKASRLLGELTEPGQTEMRRLVSQDGTKLRLSILARVMDARRFYELVDYVQATINNLPPEYHAHLTGIVPLLNDAQVQLVRTQIYSFGLAFVVVFAVIAIGFRSIRLMALCIPASLTPIAGIFTAMQLLRIPLDAATVLVAGIALGMGGNNTIHLISGFRRHTREGDSPLQAIDNALSQVGPAMIYSTIISCIGFFTLLTSAFVPMRYFGLLSGIALIIALASDVMLTLSLLVIRMRHGGKEAVEHPFLRIHTQGDLAVVDDRSMSHPIARKKVGGRR